MLLLPLFPLPQVVILPGMMMPLRFFEPRYLQLIEKVMSHEKHDFVMSRMLLRDEMDYHLSPDFEPMGCRVRVTHHRKAEDGTHEVMVRAEERGFLDEGEPGDDRLYRVVQFQSHPFPEGDFGEWISEKRASVVETMNRVPAIEELFDGWDRGHLSDRRLLNVLTSLIVQDPELLQQCLEDDEPYQQISIVEDWLRG